MRRRQSFWVGSAVALTLASNLVACSLIGAATVGVTDAQTQLALMVEAIVADLEVGVTSETPFFTPRACTRVTGQEGAFTAASVTGVLTDGMFRSELVAARLLEAGFELQRADATVEVFGRRDGMWVTVNFEPRRSVVSVDANTGCRAS